ncbi:hypothetical protein FQR65_LT14883 [Abscondita terminalis]|nr:hypothetical protein FQR65_LT14883 [Abscondita terminalis]
MFSSKSIFNVFLFVTATHAGFVNVITRGDAITRDTAVARDVFVNNGTSLNTYEKTKQDEGISTYTIVLKFFSLIIGGVAVFTLVQVLMHCCHDNKDITFQRKKKPQPPPACVIFMHSLSKVDDPDTKYKSFEYIDVEPLNGMPMMSPLSRKTLST